MGSLLLVVGFVCSLLLPILTINRVRGKVSVLEKRHLAEFPELFDADGNLTDGIQQGFESWLTDNLGFRSSFVNIAANLQLKVFRQSINERVAIGKEGWYFYTRDHNIELATGEFTLSEVVLEEIARKQQIISDYYESQGITYLLVLTAAKTSIYPEFLVSDQNVIRSTPCDQLEAYLKSHTTVQVLNTKHRLFEYKPKGKLFWKTDTHWTQLGAYAVYTAICDELDRLGRLTDNAVDVSFSEQLLAGADMSALLGATGILGKEFVPTAQWQKNTVSVQEGELWDRLQMFNQNDPDGKVNEVVLYENPILSDGTLLIYGDSQWHPARGLPPWLGECFQRVISMRIRSPRPLLDQIAEPDVVVFGCSERMIDTILTRPLEVPIIASLPNLPQKEMISAADYGDWVGNQGVWLDACNGQLLKTQGEVPLNDSDRMVTLTGWAADFNSDEPFSDVYITVGSQCVRCEYGIERAGVVERFQRDSLRRTGFRAAFPAKWLAESDNTFVFHCVSADGKTMYEPIQYHVNISV